MSYTYECRYKDFGCDVTRTKKSGIVKHECICKFAKYKKYVDAIVENEKLREEIKKLKITGFRMGRPEIKLQPCDIIAFHETFLCSTSLQNMWRHFNKKPQVAVKALIIVFLNTVPRFYKLKSLNEIEVCGSIGFIRTYKRVERHSLMDVTESIYQQMRDFLEGEHRNLGYKNIDFMKTRDAVTNDKIFLYNAMQTAAKRKPEDPIVWRSMSYDVSRLKPKTEHIL